ncbi:NAD(P)/FAD-dependent oxidoreductase [Cellulomonas fimi]|uniref:FAD-dependent pyridine nucleotide-disulfide oxidoreductase n=1 Tax=Cellulomonas fimi (strain ATCC 484 / DSM 20113 / JCM 1341 / CCUG 24087 / LMG 16345 / NBRC 15513 / NCIMB 8980 / NCTC 7547 / NRS-133) TaxID=590998 RepID=F4H5M6_CELFA|nr:FAD-dependent oxidoreductase [Cellulomonas fimi]AEE44350.1 FAD-dependent pyridine nucleotide-disulfide oxidoreductase [Cellulomonas fimi ATCC 484]NNH08125.1 FAD-dependent oxidoreductase [Cellulomonas fimi]VEH26179.1 NADH dehydrogenase-like protein SAV0941 [Cellulomonas fimi]
MTAPVGRPRRVVLLGGGYVTLHAYTALVRRVRGMLRDGTLEIVVVADSPVHHFHGFTGEVAAGLLPAHLTQTPLVEAMPRATVLHARVERVDLAARTVTFRPVDGGEPGTTAYDALVIGTGAGEPVDEVDGLDGHGLTLRRPGGLEDLAAAAEAAPGDPEPVLVVGGGLAGVELAAALADRVGGRPGRVVLVQRAERVVPDLHAHRPRLARRCEDELARLGVDVRTGVEVLAVDGTGADLSDGTRVTARTVLATTGQRPVRLPGTEPLSRDERGRLRTLPDLSVRDGVWAAGDAARVVHPRTHRPVPANALWAIKAGDQVGRNVARALQGRPGAAFRYLGLGQGAAFGVGHGIAEVWGVGVVGPLAWALRLVFFLRFLPSRRRALAVPREIARRHAARRHAARRHTARRHATRVGAAHLTGVARPEAPVPVVAGPTAPADDAARHAEGRTGQPSTDEVVTAPA